MLIERARLRAFPKVFIETAGIAPMIFRNFGFKIGSIKLHRILFRDVAYRQYDFKGELSSQRNGLRLLLEQIGDHSISLERWIELEFAHTAKVEDINQLQHSLNSFGSDKGDDLRKLYLLYANILRTLKGQREQVRLLEIGLGTNNVDIESNMGIFGSPGASLRAFRKFLRPQDVVFGADVDVRVLFQEDGIFTYFVDQLKPETLSSIANEIGSADLIIDDGLHILESNMNTVFALLPILSKGGYFVVEDVSDLPENVVAWDTFSVYLTGLGFEAATLVRCSGSLIFVIKK